MYKNEKGTYVSLDVINHEELQEHFLKYGIKVQENLHVTLAHSKKTFVPSLKTLRNKTIVIKPSELKGFDILGDTKRYFVLLFDNPEVSELWSSLIEDGSVWKWDEFKGHISVNLMDNIPYDALLKVKVPSFGIKLGNIKAQELNP